VRSHRERVRPDAPVGRRRTPGLRREELAARAGISAIWCAWIEQGRDVHASIRALCRLAEALQLSSEDRALLFVLAGRSDPARIAPAPVANAPASLVSVVEGFVHPAYALDRLWNACCWNAEAAKLFPVWLEAGGQKNLLRYAFLDRSARALVPGWRRWARRLIEEFRSDNVGVADDLAHQLVDGLQRESPHFAKAWEMTSALDPDDGVRTYCRRGDGECRFVQHSFAPSGCLAYRLVTLTPVAAI